MRQCRASSARPDCGFSLGSRRSGSPACRTASSSSGLTANLRYPVPSAGASGRLRCACQTPVTGDKNGIRMSMNPEVADAAEAAADPDRVLPQENLATTKPAEARRWVRIYAELLSFKQRVLQAAHAKLPEVNRGGGAPGGSGHRSGPARGPAQPASPAAGILETALRQAQPV